jgi:hypothetical protein
MAFSANGHTLSYDGRLYIGAHAADASGTTWIVRVFRPEALTYGSDGRLVFQHPREFSWGMTHRVDNGENALAFCATSEDQLGRREGANAIYDPFIIDSRMLPVAVPPSGVPPHEWEQSHFRRRTFRAEVRDPETAAAEIVSVASGPVEYLRTIGGQTLRGVEPTMTADGRLLVFQGAPSNDGTGDHLMYSFNPAPCARDGWSTPRPLHAMNTDPDARVREYPLAWNPLRAGTGELFDGLNPIHGAYPWVDPEGRNVLYLAALGHEARREVVTMIGADVDYAAHAIDGGINRDMTFAKLFYSSPMWRFESDQPGGQFDEHYLPVAGGHDVLPIFGSNSADYNEFDLGNVEHVADLVYADMFPLIARSGDVDFRRTADRSGLFHRLGLAGDAGLIPTTVAPTGPHARGYALSLGGAGHLRMDIEPTAPPITVPGTLRGFSVEFMVYPDPSLEGACAGSINPYRFLADAPGTFDLIYEANGSAQFSLIVDGEWVRLGFSPPLERGRWSHVAFTWDGISGQFHEYIDGIDTGRTLPRKSGTIVRPDSLTLGSAFVPSTQTCADFGRLNFIGKLDEFRMFRQARPQRSSCNAALGADCKLGAIQGTPTTAQLLLKELEPDCTASNLLNTAPCRAAMHRVCAQRGVRDALSSAENVLEAAAQLISARPPVPLGGVAVATTGDNVEVACMPLHHQTFPIEFEELAEHHEWCTDERWLDTTACEAAAHRKCATLGFTSGHLFEATARGWLTCFNADHLADVPGASLGPSCAANSWNDTACRLEVSAWCRQAGFGGGVLQELVGGTVGHVHCFNASVSTQTAFAHPFQRWATRQGGYAADQHWVTGDFNDDDRDDLARIFADAGSNSIEVHTSTGSRFTTNRWATRQAAYSASHRWFAGDFNSDGRADLAKVFDDGGFASVDVHRSTGTAFTRQRWATRQGVYSSAQRWGSGDFNGDGRIDLAKVFSDGGLVSIDVHRSTGAAFVSQRWLTRSGGFNAKDGLVTGDFTGDGRGDFAVVFDDAGSVTVDVYASTGSSFSARSRWATRVTPFLTTSEWVAADYDGDARSDIGELRNESGQLAIQVIRTADGAVVSERWGSRLEPYTAGKRWAAGDFLGDGTATMVRFFGEQGATTADVWGE